MEQKNPFEVFVNAGGGMVLFDELSSSKPSVQNVTISIVESKRIHNVNLENVYLGLSSNLLSQTKIAGLRENIITFFLEDAPQPLNNFKNKVEDLRASFADIEKVSNLPKSSF